jgi:ribosomal protein L24
MASVHVKKGDEMLKRHMKKSPTHPEGQIVTKEGTLHWSNVMRASVYDAKPRRAKASGAQ